MDLPGQTPGGVQYQLRRSKALSGAWRPGPSCHCARSRKWELSLYPQPPVEGEPTGTTLGKQESSPQPHIGNKHTHARGQQPLLGLLLKSGQGGPGELAPSQVGL